MWTDTNCGKNVPHTRGHQCKLRRAIAGAHPVLQQADAFLRICKAVPITVGQQLKRTALLNPFLPWKNKLVSFPLAALQLDSVQVPVCTDSRRLKREVETIHLSNGGSFEHKGVCTAPLKVV